MFRQRTIGHPGAAFGRRRFLQAGALLGGGLLASGLGVGLPASAATAAAATAATAVGVVDHFVLPDTPLGAFQNGILPGSLSDDHGYNLGGLGSGLWTKPDNSGHDKDFWMVTDRGPHAEFSNPAAGFSDDRRTNLVPEFNPAIVRVRAENGVLTIKEAIPITTRSGRPVLGLANIPGYDEALYEHYIPVPGTVVAPYNPNSLDPEGIVRAKGDFWICDEYSPSLVRINGDGRVITRFVPAGLALTGTDYPVVGALPAIFTKRRNNRGFEALGISRDQKKLYLVLQSPLQNPNSSTGNNSRTTRILVFDTQRERPIAEYAYRFEVATSFDPTPGTRQRDMKSSGVVVLDDDLLLIQERTDNVAKLYLADLSRATNILGSRWDNVATAPSLEALADPAAAGVSPIAKTPVVDLAALDLPGKLEGVAVVNRDTIAVTVDNDFEVGQSFPDGTVTRGGIKNQIWYVRLNQALPIP